MARATIFVPMDGGPGDAAVLEAAAALAPMFDASVDAVFVGRDDAALLMIAGDGFTGLGAAAVESLRHGRVEAETRARDVAGSAGVEFSIAKGARAHSTAHARLAALAVVDRAAARGDGALADIFQTLLMEDGAPVYVPRAASPPKRAAIAWDGSREAARALKAAGPMLAAVESAVVLQVERDVEAKDAGSAAPEFAAEWIVRHGGRAESRAVPGSLRSGRGLLDAAAESGADVLVAGAFGHARLREAVFGGVTRAFLEAETPSLFLAH